MADFIVKYWIEWLFGIIIGVITWLIKQVKEKKIEYQILRSGIVALLHDRLYTACSFFIERGWASVDDKENLECLYKPYKELGGNGTAEHLYHECMDLPMQKEDVGGSGTDDKAIKGGK